MQAKRRSKLLLEGGKGFDGASAVPLLPTKTSDAGGPPLPPSGRDRVVSLAAHAVGSAAAAHGVNQHRKGSGAGAEAVLVKADQT